MSAEVARILRDAADLIEPPGRWTRCALARDESGRRVQSKSPEAVCWCADGALRRVADDPVAYTTAYVLVLGRGGPFSVAVWNDAQPSAEPVVAALRAAADQAEGQQ